MPSKSIRSIREWVWKSSRCAISAAAQPRWACTDGIVWAEKGIAYACARDPLEPTRHPQAAAGIGLENIDGFCRQHVAEIQGS